MFYVVTVRVRGLRVGLETIDKELVRTRVYRLTRKAMNRLVVPKVELYNWLRNRAAFKINNSFVITENRLQEFHNYFLERQRKFAEVVRQVHAELMQEWPRLRSEAEGELRKRLDGEKLEKALEELERLSPPEDPEELASMSYSVLPLSVVFNSYLSSGLPPEVAQFLEQERRRAQEEVERQLAARIESLMARIRVLEEERERLLRERAERGRVAGDGLPARWRRMEGQFIAELQEAVREARALEQFGVHVDLTRAESILESLLRRRIGVRSEEPQGQRTQEG
jgi:chaperonin cofactor prefoldin